MANKIGVICVLFKKTPSGIKIMTQLRRVKDRSYDPLYDNTWELIGELREEGENVTSTIIRGCREEFGLPNFNPVRILGASDTIWSSGRNDEILCHTPFCYLESLGAPQLWIDSVFAAEVPADWEPNYKTGDGEANQCKWWTPEELLLAIGKEPLMFMTFHVPAINLFCHMVLEGKIN